MCEHKRIRCTNCEFYCLDCGAKIPAPVTAKTESTVEKHKKKGAKK